MATVQRRPGTKQGLVSRMFDGEPVPDVHRKAAKAIKTAPDVQKGRP